MTKFLAALALAFTATVSGAQAATLINGSFEDPSVDVGRYITLTTGSTEIAGWTVDGSLDWKGTYWDHADGARSLDMNGTWTGSISQNITGLVIGRQYDLSFALAGNPLGPQGIKTLSVRVGAETADFGFDTTGKTRFGNMGWVMESFRFTASNTMETLIFSSKNRGVHGPALDNVSITTAPVPLPAALWLLGGAVAGLAAIRRKA